MIPFFTLERQNKKLGNKLGQVINEVVGSGIFILGEKVDKFEKSFAKHLGVKYALGVASGTDALSLSLIALGVKEDDEVIIPANAYPTAFAVSSIGARPKLVDIDPQTFNIDPDLISKAVSKKTKAVIPVHMYGQPADMKKVLAVAKKYNLTVVEDCAQATGAEISGQWSVVSGQLAKSAKDTSGVILSAAKGSPDGGGSWRKVGSIADVGCFSFYPTKNLGCFGDGGMVVTNRKDIYQKIKLLRMYGEETRYKSVMLSAHSRLDEIQAAILLTKLKYLDKWNEKRREVAKNYELKITNHPSTSLGTGELRKKKKIQLPIETSNTKHVYHLFVIRTKKRDKLKSYLEKKDIQTAIHYPLPIHLQPAFSYLDYKRGDFPESEKASRQVLSLPMFPELSNSEIREVAEAITKFCATT